MSKVARALTIIILSLILAFSLFQYKSLAQRNDFIYFPETDHSVRGEFLEKFNSVPNPIEIYGYPITEALIMPDKSTFAGKHVQFFQRAIFESNAQNLPGHRIQLVDIGTNLYEKAQFANPYSLQANHPACEYVEDSEYQVCYDFLNFYKKHGGVSVFGKPISDLLKEQDRLAQYFEYARFEWRPELPPGKRLVLSNLGEMYFIKNSEPPEIRELGPEGVFESEVQSLQINVFPVNAVIANQGENAQTIFVIVKDQTGKPVQNAQVNLTFILPENQTSVLPMELTNDAGITSATFAEPSNQAGRVQVIVDVRYGGEVSKRTRTSYRVW